MKGHGERKEISVMFEPFTEKRAKGPYDTDLVHYQLRFVTVSRDGKVRSPGSWADDRCEFSDLEFTAIVRITEKWEVFGYGCDYRQPYCVDLGKCERMLKVLRKIAKAQESFVVQPATFGQYVAMLAGALGCTRYVKVRGEERGWHTENQHQFCSLKYLAGDIDQSLDAEKERIFPAAKPEEVTAVA